MDGEPLRPEGQARAAGGPPAPAPNAWVVEHHAGSAEQLFSWWPPRPERTVRFADVDGAAIVLGSTQRTAVAAGGAPTLRRASGGGAVWLEPGGQVWVDVYIPRGDLLWDDDVGRAFYWLGHAWAGALAGAGVPGASVHQGSLCVTQWSRQVCFAGLGPGEVTVAGRKAVGISQRRTRDGALFQCAALLRWDPSRLAAALGLPPSSGPELAAAAGPVAADAATLRAALLDALPR